MFGPLGGSGAGLGQATLLPSTTCAAGCSGACARTQRAACGGAQAAAFVQLGLGEEEGPEITVTGATRLKSKHTILPPDTKIVTSSNLASGPFSYHPQHRSQRRRHEKGSRSASG